MDVKSHAGSLTEFGVFMDKMTEGNLFEKIRLKNGLDARMYDRSRHTAGDRCQVIFEVRIDVDLKPEYFSSPPLSALTLEEARSILGNKTSYHYQKERNFIAEDKKMAVLENMKTDFLDTNLQYLSSPEFPPRLIKKNYKDAHAKMLLKKKQQDAWQEKTG